LNVDGSTASDITEYRIYYGTSMTSLTQTIQVPGATTTSTVVSGLAPGTYYFAVAAVNSFGEASAQTNFVSVTLP
jgi:predicted phage tail protein